MGNDSQSKRAILKKQQHSITAVNVCGRIEELDMYCPDQSEPRSKKYTALVEGFSG